MNDNKACKFFSKKWCVFTIVFKLAIVFTLLFFLIIFPTFCLGQENPQYDEVTVYLKVQGVGGAFSPALIKGDIAYLSISDFFTFLKIKNNPSARLDSLSGFFIKPQDEYLIDRAKKQIVFQGKKIELKSDDLILTETNLYMKANLFGEVFGLNCVFSFRDLSVVVTTKLELPLIREMKMEQMRDNLKRLKGELKTDTTIGRSYPLFEFGMADWAISNSQQQGMNPNTQLDFSQGAVIAGGEMNVGLHYDQIYGFDSRQQNYLWRYVNNDHKALRQISVGKITPQTISTLNGSLVGIQLTNTPTIYRRSFGTYTLSNVTEPGWQVELYVNNVLVDYVKADASGFYKFEVPLVYGNSVMMVRMYGPWGEVRTRIENANIPFNFLPPGVLEYAVNAGVIENMTKTKFSRTNVNYGVSRRMSIGGGYEYFSSPLVENSLPFIGTSVMLLDNLLMAGEYTFGVLLKSSLSYRLPSNIQLELNFTGYEKDQKAILYAPFQEHGVSISIPIQGKHFSSYSRLSLVQTIYSDYKTTNAEFLFSGNIFGVNSNVTTTAMYLDPRHINAYTNLSLSFRLPGQFTLMPSAQYNYNQKRMASIRCNLQKPLFGKGYLNISYERNFIGKIGSLDVGLRYDFSFMQTGLGSRLSKNANAFSQSARGSLLFDRKTKYIGISKNNMVGKGGFTFLAYLDLNGNEKRDSNEPKVLGLNVRVNGGRIVKSDKDSTIRVIDLTPYTSYLVELDKNSFQSISWKIKNLTMSAFADPNYFKTIEVPVEVMGEASGTVNVKSENGARGLGRVYVCFYRNNQMLAGRTLTEGDGYFSYMNLQPGNYKVRIDSSQLKKIRMTASPEFKMFTVKPSKDGDIVEGLDFTLQSIIKDSVSVVMPKIMTVPLADSSIKITNSVIKEINPIIVVQDSGMQNQKSDSILPGVRYSGGITLSKLQKETVVTDLKTNVKPAILIVKPILSKILIVNSDSLITEINRQHYTIQVGAFSSKSNALAEQQKLIVAIGKPVEVVFTDGLYKLWIVGFSDKKEAVLFKAKLAKKGFKGNIINLNSQVK